MNPLLTFLVIAFATAGVQALVDNPKQADHLLTSNVSALRIADYNKTIMEVKQNGDFIYKGKLVTNDKEIYENMKQFFSGHHCECK